MSTWRISFNQLKCDWKATTPWHSISISATFSVRSVTIDWMVVNRVVWIQCRHFYVVTPSLNLKLELLEHDRTRCLMRQSYMYTESFLIDNSNQFNNCIRSQLQYLNYKCVKKHETRLMFYFFFKLKESSIQVRTWIQREHWNA